MGTGEFVLGVFEIAYASGSPTISVDKDNLTASVADTGTGVITVTMNHRYTVLHAFVNAEAAGGLTAASVAVKVDGLAADNTLAIYVVNLDVDPCALADEDGTYTVLCIGRLTAGA